MECLENVLTVFVDITKLTPFCSSCDFHGGGHYCDVWEETLYGKKLCMGSHSAWVCPIVTWVASKPNNVCTVYVNHLTPCTIAFINDFTFYTKKPNHVDKQRYLENNIFPMSDVLHNICTSGL